MVKIQRGDHETLVSVDSYNTIFKPLGYTLVEDKKVEAPKKTESPKKVEVPKVEEPKVEEKETKKKKK